MYIKKKKKKKSSSRLSGWWKQPLKIFFKLLQEWLLRGIEPVQSQNWSSFVYYLSMWFFSGGNKLIWNKWKVYIGHKLKNVDNVETCVERNFMCIYLLI